MKNNHMNLGLQQALWDKVWHRKEGLKGSTIPLILLYKSTQNKQTKTSARRKIHLILTMAVIPCSLQNIEAAHNNILNNNLGQENDPLQSVKNNIEI